MMMKTDIKPLALNAGLLALLSMFPPAGWTATAGHFQFVAGEVRVLGSDGRERPASKGGEISEGETIVTSKGASAQLRMVDGGVLALRPDTRLQVTTYFHKGGESGSGKAGMSLFKGGLRSISGLIGKTSKENYAITTPTATIGIRGTDHEPFVIPPPPPGQQPSDPPGTYDKVNVGATSMTTQAGTTVIQPNQVGFAGSPNQPPILLPRIPSFYQVTPSPSAARPPQPGSRSDNRSASSSQGSGDGDAPATTTAASGDGSGNAMRVGGEADAGIPNVAAAGGSPPPSDNLPNTAAAAANAPSSSQGRLTGENDSGDTLDVTNNEVTKSDGSTVAVQDYTITIPNQTGVQYRAGSYDYLPSVLTGIANYTMVGGTVPADADGNTGTLLSASLNVNFSTQLAYAEVGLRLGGSDWGLKADRMVLDGRSFSSDRVDCRTGTCGLTLTRDNVWTYGAGSLSGELTGDALTGAKIDYHFSEGYLYGFSEMTNPTSGPTMPISGSVTLAGPAQSLTTPWRGVGITTGWGSEGAAAILDDYGHHVLTVADYRGFIESRDGQLDSVLTNDSGQLTQFVGRAALASDYEVRDAIIQAGTANNLVGGSAMLGEVKVSWGRWENGAIDIYSRDGATKLGTIDNTGRSLHWLTTGVLNGPVTTLPLTGTATYSLVGHTLPTDMQGNTGTLASATLSANFTAMNVDASVTVNMGSGPNMTTLSTAATGMHLQAGGGFQSNPSGSLQPASHTASCHGPACGGGPVQGFINGTFVGAGAAGAVMAYGIASGTAQGFAPPPGPGTAVTGIAVFKK